MSRSLSRWKITRSHEGDQATPGEWLESAASLYYTAEILLPTLHRDTRDALQAVADRLLQTEGDDDGEGADLTEFWPVNHRYHVFAMITGLSLENALKGLMQVLGERPPTRGHPLARLIAATKTADPLRGDLEESEFMEVVQRMEAAVIWSAKYPAPLKGPRIKVTGFGDPSIQFAIARRACDLLDALIRARTP